MAGRGADAAVLVIGAGLAGLAAADRLTRDGLLALVLESEPERRGADRVGAGDFWEHLGGGGGFWCMMRIYPARGVGVLTMGNATSYDHGAVAAVCRDHRVSE